MIKHVTRLLFIVAALMIAVAATVATSAPPALADPAVPSSTTQADAPTATDPPPGSATPTTQPETTTPPPSTATTERPPTSTQPSSSQPPSTTPENGLGTITITAIDIKTGIPVSGVTVDLRSDDAHRVVASPDRATMPAGTVHVAVIAIPDGYNWAEPDVSTISLAPNDHAVVTVRLSRPELRGAISITKRDRITGAALAGARYRLAPCQGAVGAVIVTGDDGVGTQWIRHGCYVLTEIQAPAGYALDSTERTVTIIPAQTLALTLYDTPLAPVVVVRDPGNRVPLTSVPTGRTS